MSPGGLLGGGTACRPWLGGFGAKSQVHFKICCQTEVVWPTYRGTNGDLFPISGSLCWQDCSWTVDGWDLVLVTDCFEIYSWIRLAGLPQGMLDYGFERLNLGHRPLQGPKLGLRSWAYFLRHM